MTHTAPTNGEYSEIPDAKEGDGWESHVSEASDDEHETKRQNTNEIVDASKSKSKKIFKVKHSEYIKYNVFYRTKWIVIPIFLSFTLITIIISILYFINDITKVVAFAIILCINLLGGILGATFVYNYGTIEQSLNILSLENKWYEKDLDKLEESRKTVLAEAKNIHFEVHKLNSLAKDLEEQLADFEHLRKELQAICETNENMKTKLDEVNTICNDILAAIKLNQRAHLLSTYYKLITKREELQGHLTRKDYEEFLMRLNENTRKEIEKHGGFESIDVNNDGKIHLNEFEKLINNVLEIDDDHEAVYLRKLKQLHYK